MSNFFAIWVAEYPILKPPEHATDFTVYWTLEQVHYNMISRYYNTSPDKFP